MGRDIQPPQDLLFWGGGLIHFTGLVFPGPPGRSSMVFSPEYSRIFLRYSQVSPWVSVGFPGKKINWIEAQNPPCLHTFRKVYVAIGSCQWCPHKAYIFRFNTPTNNTFPASGTHTCLILRDYPPSSHTFLAKSDGVNPPLCSYIIRNVGSTPPTPEPVGVGDVMPLRARVQVLPQWHKRLSRSIELGAQHVSPHQTTIKRKKTTPESRVPACRSCHVMSNLSLWKQNCSKKTRFQEVQNGCTLIGKHSARNPGTKGPAGHHKNGAEP